MVATEVAERRRSAATGEHRVGQRLPHAPCDEDEAAVYVVEDGEAARRPVRTGIVSGDVVEVLDGLLETDRIIIVGQGAVREGGKVLAMQSDRASIAG